MNDRPDRVIAMPTTRRTPATPDLTLCTVSYGHGELIRHNFQLGERLNPGFARRVRWEVADNAWTDEHACIAAAPRGIRLQPGSPETGLGPSHHHAVAMNALVHNVETRFALILDPDFFLLRPNWVSDVLAWMQDRGLAFFGAPWHPRYVHAYRYFPAVHCMFVDLARVDRSRLDFRPRLELADGPPPSGHLSAAMPWLRHRKRVAWDTGVRVHEHFGNGRAASECVTPVLRRNREFAQPLSSRVLERLLPDRYCYLPKQAESYTEHGFEERGWNRHDLPALWEESIWRDQPFGLHMRRSFSAGTREASLEAALLPKVLEDVLALSAPAERTRHSA